MSNFVSNFKKIKGKVIDKDIVLKLLAKEFFEETEDRLDDEAFGNLKGIFEYQLASIPEENICTFVDQWLRGIQIDRLEWLVVNIGNKCLVPTESIKDRLVIHPVLVEEIHRGLASKLINIFDLGNQEEGDVTNEPADKD